MTIQATPTDMLQALSEWNDTRSAYPREICIHEAIAAQVRRSPLSIAATWHGQSMTYGELNARANRLAHRLLDLGVAPNEPIALHAERGLDMLVGMLGILKAGAAYLPLEPGCPDARLQTMLDQAGAMLLLVSGAGNYGSSDSFGRLRLEVGSIAVDRRYPDTDPDVTLSADHLAYVIFTSGSSGTPKGVMVPDRAVLRLVTASYFPVTPDDRVLNASSFAFDPAVMEIWGALIHGAQLVLTEPRTLLAPDDFAALLRERQVSVVVLTTALFHQIVDERPGAFSGVRSLYVGGEAMDPERARLLLALPPDRAPQELWNVYGPTENATVSTAHLVRRIAPGARSVPIGRPLSNSTCYVLDERMQPVDGGEEGELWLGGDGLARGYIHRPELTAERFVANPFPGRWDDRLYRTGDRVRRLADGELDFIGRVDDQVKLRGFRVEPREIELALQAHPGVREAVVLAETLATGEKRLAAYAACGDEATAIRPAELRRFLAASLPEYMVPASIFVIERLPWNANRKIDREVLRALTPRATIGEDRPRNPTEQELCTIWERLLDRDAVGIHEHFLDLGGDSLLGARMIGLVRQRLGRALAISEVLSNPTVAQLAERLADVPTQDLPGWAQRRPIPELTASRAAPLTFSQRSIWTLAAELAPDLPLYNEAVTVHIRGEVDPLALASGLRLLIQRHEGLRLSFARDSRGEPVQVPMAAASVPIELHVIDLSAEEELRARERFISRATEVTCAPFDLTRPPLMRALLARITPERSVLCLAMHHLIADGTSIYGVLLPELADLYATLSHGGSEAEALTRLPAVELEITDFAAWLHTSHCDPEFQEGVLAHQARHWGTALAGMQPLRLPTDRARPAVPRFRGSRHLFELPAELATALKRVGSSEGATFFMTLLAAFNCVMSRHSGQDDIVLGTVDATRASEKFERTVGFFLETLVLRTRLDGVTSFREAIRRTREAVLGALAHRDVPFESLARDARAPGPRNVNPLFQVAFVLEPPLARLPSGWEVRQDEIDTGTSKFDLTFELDDFGSEGVRVRVEYDADLFEPITIERISRHFCNLLTAMVADLEQSPFQASMLDASETDRLLEWSAPRTVFAPSACLHDLFSAQAARTPDAIALSFGAEQITYRELDERTNRLGRHLRSLGMGPESRVALCVDRSPDIVLGILGILKAGAAYVPLDPSYPASRLRFMAEDTGTRVILTQARFVDKVRALAPDSHTVCLDREWPLLSKQEDATPFASGADPLHLAYIIYTSGSTGQPKGAMIAHHSVVRLFEATRARFGFGVDDVWTLFHSCSFDMSVWEIWGALLHGGRLVVVPYTTSRSPEAQHRLLREEGVTVLSQTPTAFRQLIQADAELFGAEPELGLKVVVFGGEALDFAMLRPWFERYGERCPRMINMYGITETTVHTTFREVTYPDVVGATRSLIGPALPDLGLYILDRSGGLAPIGVFGEIHVSGDGVARGYLERASLTKERFIPNPYARSRDLVLYKSGDVARYLPDGDIEFMGRLDHQVKVRGFRIELKEIEAALVTHPGVRDAIALVREVAPGDPRIFAYVIPREHSSPRGPTSRELREFLHERLPDHMVPATLVQLDAYPVNNNGKLDREALPVAEIEGGAEGPDFEPPVDEWERAVAEIWSATLKLERVGRRDDFFSLGGHSLVAAQMIAQVRDRYAIEVGQSLPLLRQFLEDPTLCGFAGLIRSIKSGAPGRADSILDFEAEVKLDPSIRFDVAPADLRQIRGPSHILLTGATGFLGTFLLAELLQRTTAQIHCIVRARDDAAAYARLRNGLGQALLWDDAYASRIVPLAGDLALPLLGLSESAFTELTRRIDVIYHNGSLVNFIYPYKSMKRTNVLGTQEIIRLATTTRMKPVQYVSSLSVVQGFGLVGAREVSEDEPLAHADKLYMGYLETKYVAEKILLQAARRGLPVAIHRPKDVSGHSSTGVWKPEHFMCCMLKTLVDLKVAPRIPLPLDWVPVDYVAAGIVEISRKQLWYGKVFHYSQPNYEMFERYTEHLKRSGYDLRDVSDEEFKDMLVEYSASNPRAPITPFVPLFTAKFTEKQLTQLEMYYPDVIPRFGCDNTLSALEGTGITCPKIDDGLLDTCLGYFQRTGFFPLPEPH